MSVKRSKKKSNHGADEREGRSEKYRASEFGKEEINNCADAGAEQRSRLRHSVSDDTRNGDCCCQNRENLLECEDEQLAEAWFVLDVVDEIHKYPPDFLNPQAHAYERKMPCRMARHLRPERTPGIRMGNLAGITVHA